LLFVCYLKLKVKEGIGWNMTIGQDKIQCSNLNHVFREALIEWTQRYFFFRNKSRQLLFWQSDSWDFTTFTKCIRYYSSLDLPFFFFYTLAVRITQLEQWWLVLLDFLLETLSLEICD
jgi:hypothetical protein